MCTRLTLGVITFVAGVALAAPAHASPIVMHSLGGFGGDDSLERLQQLLRPLYQPDYLLAQVVCSQTTNCANVDGVLDADLFGVAFDPDPRLISGTWGFAGHTTPVSRSGNVYLIWNVQYVVVRSGFTSHLYVLGPPAGVTFPPAGVSTADGVLWDTYQRILTGSSPANGRPLEHLSFYGSAQRIPEPASLGLLAIGAAIAAWRRVRRGRRLTSQ